jgi:hypothetical protein
MKTYTLVFLVWILTGCATHQGTDGRTYYWIAPLPINNPHNQATSTSATTSYYQVNGRSYTVTSFK